MKAWELWFTAGKLGHTFISNQVQQKSTFRSEFESGLLLDNKPANH